MKLPEQLPDELLFSRLVRYIIACGEKVHWLQQIIYSNYKANVHPFLTAGVERLADLTGENAKELIYHQTLAPLFLAYLPQHADTITEGLLSGNNYKALRASQLQSFREKEQITIKFCPDCAREDILNCGVAYWHVSHQLPGIESCANHGVWLHHKALQDRSRLDIGLPPSDVIAKPSPIVCKELSFYIKCATERLAQGSKEYCKTRYSAKLKNLGYITASGNVRRRYLCRDFYDFVEALEYPQTSLLPTCATDFKYLSNLLIEGATQHPFKHLLFSFWLEKVKVSPKVIKPIIKEPSNKKIEKEDLCVGLLKTDNSLAEVARQIGKSRCYVKSIALKYGITDRLKPSKLSAEVIEKVKLMAYQGWHRQAIATRFKISTGSVEMIISTEKGLVDRRLQCRFESRRRRYRCKILRYLQTYPKAIIKDVKENCSAEYYWLYGNDKEWLKISLPEKTKPTIRR